MDDLEFRRRLLADPFDNSQDLAEARNESIANRKLSDELQQLDNKLEQAMKVDVPDDLADRILFHQSGQPSSNSFKPRTLVAMAASVAFVFGLFIGQYNQGISASNPQLEIAQIAMEHVKAEAPFIDGIDESVTLSQVNAKLTPFGSTFNDIPGHVYYVNHCGFGNKNALHMVMDTPQGKVTVFVVPEQSPDITPFNDQSMKGVVVPVRNASLIVVGENGQDVSPVATTLRNELNWEI
ncbi:DUF3379 domain-containing protein [Photobacterium sp. ZSDE20]|uniref:DUF3379 domain-containing protein n=1 Tax=Photobacterium pectinilyticum TaxID=2906793 RepID=A0ABT1N4F5_9GAMM|nr:DUF3379 domain-containing protein [Photobacterium sp. ZSDE20]MCQ1059590.1 DUF3379 domain-containing protein [Photobacterium sp. ZSDE20]MDD1825453.1 DUF3379 domain-containing protein [Photobacterium sp. ZSDE20]